MAATTGDCRMKTLFAAAALAAICLTGAQASAATLVLGAGGPDYYYQVHNDAAPTGASVTLTTQPGDHDVFYTSGSVLDPGGNGNGYATVTGPFSWLVIDPGAPILGFTDIGFNLDPFVGTGPKPTFTFDLILNFVGGAPSQTFSTGFAANNKFDVHAGPGEVIQSIELRNLTALTTIKGKQGAPDTLVTSAANFDSIRQVSFNGPLLSAVPEPSTWGMMIVGFGAAGAMLRSARRRQIAVLA